MISPLSGDWSEGGQNGTHPQRSQQAWALGGLGGERAPLPSSVGHSHYGACLTHCVCAQAAFPSAV